MINSCITRYVRISKLVVWIFTALLFMHTSTAQASDWMHNSSKFSMSTSSDHVTLKPFLCDLDRSNTYAKNGGIYAQSGSQTVWIMDVYYKDEGSDENPYGKVYARYCVGESRAWFTNGYGSQEQKIEFGGKDFLIQKWGDDNHYCTPKIDFYYHASMAGKTWTFYYQYEHNKGGTYTMTLGTAYLSPTLGHARFNTGDFQYERTSPDKIKFTVPALPDDIASKLNEVHIREGKYTVTFTYTRQDNLMKDQTETFECQKGNKKTYEVTIPSDVGNPKKIDLRVEAIDGLKDSKNYYWKDVSNFSRTDIFKIVPLPNSLTTEFRQFDKAADLSWNAYPSGGNNYLECKPYIYRMETDKDGKSTGGSWSKRGTLDNAGSNQALGYHDNNVNIGTYYKYMILNVPKDWIGNGINESQLNNPSDDLLNRLGYVESELLSTKPELSIYDLKQDESVTDKVKLTWLYTRIPTSASSVTFKVMRKTSNDGEWAEYGTVNGDAQPSAGTLLSFIDSDLPNASVRYQYKIRLTLDNVDYDSEPITAGLLSGSSVKSFSATKGTHESTVRLSWEATQVGTDNTTFVISRRYVNSEAEYIRINTTSGTNSIYTYEDNTVQPGYYYEYKIEAYSGGALQNTLIDAGFCQARGVISGRVTFGSGDAVEDVRLTLRASNADDGNAVKGYSQRVDGASTGIVWNADSTEIAKVFGADKNYTVQLFVRPDENLQEGAVIGNIPGVGELYAVPQNGSYKVYSKRPTITKKTQEYTETNVIRAIVHYPYGYSSYSTKYDEENGFTIYSYSDYEDVCSNWNQDGFKTGKNYATEWWGSNVQTMVLHKKKALDTPVAANVTETSYDHYDMGVELTPGIYSLLTVNVNNGNITTLVNDGTPAEWSFVKHDDNTVSTAESSDGYVVHDGKLVSFEGNLCPQMPVTGWMWQGLTNATHSNDPVVVSTGINHNVPFSVGGAQNVEAAKGFAGNFAEVRVWNHILSDKEKNYYYDRVLNGRETGLSLYWPMDEGLDHYVFDASYANDMPNGRHANVGNNIVASNIVPLDNQLSRYATTSATGEYIIRGIPFVGSGSTYTILPTRGIHEFSPISRNGFIGSGSLTLNSYDFTDTSSFPLKGKITYLNTNIPVDSVQFMIDGNMVQSKEGVRSDSNGEYEISVPIGEHLIECYKNGHKFSSFPIDGSKYDFKKAEIANFVDSTLVNVTGRVNGGFSDMDAPLGFRQSVNRLGKATIKLSIGRESQCSFNYIVNDRGEGEFGVEDLEVVSATDSIQSTAYRSGTHDTSGYSDDKTHYIIIKTDEKTGEFSAMLPPLKYKVESITFENDQNGDIYNDKPIFAQNLPLIDASNTIKEKMETDSIAVEGSPTLKYTYSAKMLRQYRVNPTISVVQTSPLLSKTIKNVYGEKKIGVTNADFTVDSVTVANITDDSYSYPYAHPIFVQDKTYTYDISVAESYKNVDNGETFTEIPQDAVIHIANDASSTTVIYGEDKTVNGNDVSLGEAYQTANLEITPDEKGHITYSFVAGAPNFATGHIHNMSVGVTVDGRTTMWEAPDSNTDALDLIVLGSIGTGTNFVTRGPDAVDMIIRRPPGSTSVASLTNKTIRSYSHTTVESSTSGWTGGGYISETPTWEVSMGAVMGIATLTKSKFKIVVNQTLKATRNYSDQDIAVNDTTYTVTEQMVTPSSMTIDLSTMTFVPETGDTYIGRSTNLLFSKGRMLGLYKQDDGTYKLDVKNGVTVGQEFDTKFVFPQAYIENTLIPNWEAIIKSKLEEGYINGDHWDKSKAVAVPGKVIYYTKYKPGDPEFGRANGDKAWTTEQLVATHGYPSYMAVNGTNDPNVPDEVEDAINQIKVWRDRIYDNEKDKLDAFASESNLIQNYSIATGTKVSTTTETTVKSGTSHKHDFSKSFSVVGQLGETFNDAGVIANLGYSTGSGDSNTDGSSTTISNAVAWTMSDGDPRTALSVDVYKSPLGWGPIFRTRGGQTVNPYEAGSVTKYYQKGTTLNEATMKVENPQLKVIGSTELSDVPTGTEAKFTLQLSNQSETNDICNYVLQVKDKSNPNGAILMMDGAALSNGKTGRLFKMKGGETINKTLIVSQGDKSIIDYEDIIIQLKSEKDPSIESEEVKLRVHFVPASARVDLSVDHTVLNQEYKKENGGIIAKMYNLDRQDNSLQGIRLRYRRKGVDTWSLIKQWTTIEELLTQGYEKMPDGSQFTEKVTFLEDGQYELQAQSFGKYGADDVTFESDIIEITQDTHGPKILGMVSPESGQLTYLNRNDMHLRFNEVLNGNALSKSDNFRIEGGMNNVVFGGNAYPDVAAQLNENTIETEALYDLSNSNYAFDMWFYRQGDGTIISLGTDNNLLSLSTHDGGKLRARVGSEKDVYETYVQLPENKWFYLAMNYKRKTADDAQNRITMLYATSEDTEANYVGKNMPAHDLDGHGKLSIGGDGMQGMVAALSIWNSDVTATQLYEERNRLRASYTPGLVGYWEMDEGHGVVLNDRARSRHMHMESESWYINNENRATHLDADHHMPINISTFSPAKTDNYAIEMWFRGGEDANNNSTLFSAMNGIKVGFDAGKLKLQVIEQTENDNVPVMNTTQDIVLSDKTYLDNTWHHFALNIRRGTSAIAYIDGDPIKVIPETDIPGLNAKYLQIGGWEMASTGSIVAPFIGDVDDVRIWSAALEGQIIKERMYNRLNNSYAGLVGYFPMEEIHRTQQGTVTTEYSKGNFGEADSSLTIDAEITQSTNAPALLPGSTKMRLEDTQFDFTTSDSELYFSFPSSSLPLMDNNDFAVTVKNIKDEHGNKSEPVEWIFHADFASVSWDVASIEMEKKWDESLSTWATILNKTGSPQMYEVTGAPSWMTIDKPIGTVDGEALSLEISVAPSVSIGHHVAYLYLTDQMGIRRVLPLHVIVKGDVPDWSVDGDRYESNMIVTGQVYVSDKICENTDTKIAVFDEMGYCRGVASPAYVPSRAAYYVDMIVYGAAATSISTGKREMTMKMYDGSSGKIYPVVKLSTPDGSTYNKLTYAPDAWMGTYDAPVIFRSTEEIEQTSSLPFGWSWISIYVQPESTAIADVLPKNANELMKYRNIKSRFSFASAKTDGSAIIGELTEITPGNMYKIQTSAATNLEVFGTSIDVRNTEQTIHPGYNWIGTLADKVMSPEDAFADLSPVKNDMVKSRNAMAVYNGNGLWEGTLKNIIPGQGYIYLSGATSVKTFHYPLISSTAILASKLNPFDEEEQSNVYTPVDPYQYPDNMNMIAVIEKDGEREEDAELGAFINGECRGTVHCNNGYYFLTIMGASLQDANGNIELRITIGGQEYILNSGKTFISDAIYGTLDDPFVLDLNTTGIHDINKDDPNDTEWYTLQGIKLGKRPTVSGVYIHNGKKETIGRKHLK